ncbi:MAG: response regulator transcription factor [Planctomycetes bacterium]|nr:response regulator transcription factor [Planctomycetota bacterium]
MASDAVVYVVDDDPDVRKSPAELVSSIKLPVRCHASATEFLDDYDPALPGCLVVDVRMPGMSGIELLEKIRRLGTDMPVIVLTGHGDVPMAVRALKSGAVDFLAKPCPAQTLIDRIQHALQIDAEFRAIRAEKDETAKRCASLTERERSVVERIVSGMTTRRIAAELRVSTQAVDAPRGRAMKNPNVATIAALAVLVAGA